MGKRLFVFVCICLLLVNIATAEEKSSRPIVLSLPDLNWALEIDAIGFSMEDFEIAPHGNAIRFQAANKKTGIILSGFLEKAPKKGNSKDCRSYYWSEAQKSPFPKTNIKMSESGDTAIVEYFMTEYMGQKLNQKHLNAYMVESDFWIDIHLSKAGYKPDDQQLFEAVLNGVSIKKNHKPDSLMLFHYGNLFYRQKKYSKAIPYYRQALNVENKDKSMPRLLWFVLVDQLGVSYGISGDIENAKKIYNSAISKEPEYPMFYYNLACACAESNDPDGAIKNLKLAYKYKNNMLPGEILPNPRNDSSFNKYINTAKFKAELDRLE
jgi:tetratricopeptide (TPR) repeat protein